MDGRDVIVSATMWQHLTVSLTWETLDRRNASGWVMRGFGQQRVVDGLQAALDLLSGAGWELVSAGPAAQAVTYSADGLGGVAASPYGVERLEWIYPPWQLWLKRPDAPQPPPAPAPTAAAAVPPMRTCPQGHENHASRTTCGVCGAPLTG